MILTFTKDVRAAVIWGMFASILFKILSVRRILSKIMQVKIQENAYLITVHGTSSFAATDRHKLLRVSEQRTEISTLTQERGAGRKKITAKGFIMAVFININRANIHVWDPRT